MSYITQNKRKSIKYIINQDVIMNQTNSGTETIEKSVIVQISVLHFKTKIYIK